MTTDQRIDDLISRLDPQYEYQAASIQMLREFKAQKHLRYSNEDCDVLGSAAGAIGKTVVPEYARVWVDRMLANATAGIAA